MRMPVVNADMEKPINRLKREITMLIPRIITGLILVLLVVGSVLLLSPIYFSFGLAVVMLLAAWEWYALSCARTCMKIRALYVVASAVMMYLSTIINSKVAFWMLYLATFWWIIACILILSYPKTEHLWRPQWIRLLAGWLVLIPTWYALSFLRVQSGGDELILYMVMTVGAADVGAYFAGCLFGKNRLAPTISPGKTWEGVAGGIIVSLILTLLVATLAWSLTVEQTIGFIILAILLSVLSVFGDLLESMFKRAKGIKDSGKILPGHGGILDRIDSITAAAPPFVLLFPYLVNIKIF